MNNSAQQEPDELTIKQESEYRELQAYCASKSEILKLIEESLTFNMSGLDMVIASYLSDAQELIAANDLNRARQYINIAKMLIFERMESEAEDKTTNV